MKKDAVYSMRMNSRVREALKMAANKERRTVASLLDKIVTDYLVKEHFLSDADFGSERRNYRRKKITMPVKTHLARGSTRERSFAGVILDLSQGGALVTYPKRSDFRFNSIGGLPDFQLSLEVPELNEELEFSCETRHMLDTGNEIHIGACFHNPAKSDLEKLDRYLMQNCKDEN
jgi:hypothetical protein